MILHQEMPEEVSFIRSSGYDGVLFFFKVIVLVIEVQIYCSFSLRCFSRSIIIKHIKLKIYYWICFPYTSKISLYILKFYGLKEAVATSSPEGPQNHRTDAGRAKP